MKKECNVNFGKVSGKSVKIFDGDSKRKDIEIIGSKGKYSVWTDPKNKELSKVRGKTGTLSEVKKEVSKFLCGATSQPQKVDPPQTKKATPPQPKKEVVSGAE